MKDEARDTLRLNWLESKGSIEMVCKIEEIEGTRIYTGRAVYAVGRDQIEAGAFRESLRAAIDAAMKES